MTLMYPGIWPYAHSNLFYDLSGRGRHLTALSGTTGTEPLIKPFSFPDTSGREHTGMGVEFGGNESKGFGTPQVAEDHDPNKYTHTGWMAVTELVHWQYRSISFCYKDPFAAPHYQWGLGIRGSTGLPGGSYDYPIFRYYGSGLNGVEDDYNPYYNTLAFLAETWDNNRANRIHGFINDDYLLTSVASATGGFLSGTRMGIGACEDIGTSFAGPLGPILNVRMYNRTLSDDAVRELYLQPWLGYEEYGRTLISIPAAAASASYAPVGVGGGLVGRARGLVA